MKACTAISLDSRVRYFLIFDKFLSWLNDDLQMSETCASNIMLSSTTTPSIGGGCQPLITDTEVAEG